MEDDDGQDMEGKQGESINAGGEESDDSREVGIQGQITRPLLS